MSYDKEVATGVHAALVSARYSIVLLAPGYLTKDISNHRRAVRRDAAMKDQANMSRTKGEAAQTSLAERGGQPGSVETELIPRNQDDICLRLGDRKAAEQSDGGGRLSCETMIFAQKRNVFERCQRSSGQHVAGPANPAQKTPRLHGRPDRLFASGQGCTIRGS